MKLAFGPTVADAFKLPRKDLIAGTVAGWHQTLAVGFHNGFGKTFQLISGPAESDLVLLLEEAELEIVPAAVNGELVRAQVRYRAALGDGSGAQRLAVGTAESKKAASPGDVTDAAASAVETMYEDIAQKLFAQPAVMAPADSPPRAAPPSQSL